MDHASPTLRVRDLRFASTRITFPVYVIATCPKYVRRAGLAGQARLTAIIDYVRLI
ncbi:MAG: hypothetical protein IID16_07705 [Candidatus Marinimicrobia bacterium]|nr:hypothetical protein [Candidatus Neomarinimicrobiota bacterium]